MSKMRINRIYKLDEIVDEIGDVEESDKPRGVFELFEDATRAVSYYVVIGTAVIGELYLGLKFYEYSEKLASGKNISATYQKIEQ